MLMSSSVLGVGDTGQVPEGTSSCTGTLGDGTGLLRVDRWWSSWLTVGEVLAMGACWV